MIISPPFIRDRNTQESDAAWTERMMPVDARRGFPANTHVSWHGGIHITHTNQRIDVVRAIADGVVVSFRNSSGADKRDAFPLNYNGRTDDGYVLLKHETDIGENNSVVFYSLYMHLQGLDPAIGDGAKIWRKDPLGQPGMVDETNAFHFQVFCDDENMLKLTGRTTPELDIIQDGRTDTVYGDIHFYLPPGTVFYDRIQENNSSDTSHLNVVHTSQEPLYVSMTLAKGDCTMVTRRQNATTTVIYDMVGEPLVNTDANPADNTIAGTELKYEYNLYNTATRLYPQSPSAGFELLRFGRIINTDHETLIPANAPLWRTVNFPGGSGVVNLALPEIRKFSDADFPHWAGWRMIDDDNDNNSQCNSTIINDLQESGHLNELSSKLVCHFPLEWNATTFDPRYSWLKTANDNVPAMSEADYNRFKNHASALCFEQGELSTGRLWHFHPASFITHFRKCSWLSKQELKQLVPMNVIRMARRNDYRWETITYRDGPGSMADNIRSHLNIAMQKYLINTPTRIACFLGNAIQETQWLSRPEEGGARQLWYYPWHGRGLLQLTGPANYFNYFSFRGRSYPENIKIRLSTEYNRLYANGNIRQTDNHLSDTENDVPANVIEWRNNVRSDNHEMVNSAGFYWISAYMAYHSDAEHELERCDERTNSGVKVYYRSPTFWKASAAVNLTGHINRLYSSALNGFNDRCCVYGSAISVLTEQKFPDSNGNAIVEKPESNQLRRG